jgi:hypothetical protein
MNKINYRPNYSDPRVQVRVIKSIDFVKRYLSSDQSQWLSTRWIDYHLGSQRNQLSRYLRGLLLICVDEQYSKRDGICKRYRLNHEGLNFLETKVDTNTYKTTYSVVDLTERFQDELENDQITYNDTSDRLYHWLQNQKRAVKKQVFESAGLNWTYDIVCSAPTLFHQKSQQLGMDLYLPYLRDYLVNRKSIRNQLAEESELDDRTIKRIINGLFQGAQISKYRRGRCYQELDGDLARIEFLKEHEFIQGLKEDIRVMWSYLRPLVPKRTITQKNGSVRSLPISGRQKTALYRKLERQVLDVIKQYLSERNIKFYTEHDGWSSDKQIDLCELSDYVRDQTGFVLEFETQEFIVTHTKQHIV